MPAMIGIVCRLALAAESVTGAADERCGAPEWSSGPAAACAGDGEQEEQAHDEGHRVVLSRRPSRHVCQMLLAHRPRSALHISDCPGRELLLDLGTTLPPSIL